MSGGKGGKQTSKADLFPGQKELIDYITGRTKDVAGLPFAPYIGPDVAAFTPAQEAAMMGAARGAESYGLIAPDTGAAMVSAGMPEAQTFAGGIRGYSSFPLFQESLAQQEIYNPGYMEAIRRMFPMESGQTTLPYYYPNADLMAGLLSEDQYASMFDEEGNYLGNKYYGAGGQSYNPYGIDLSNLGLGRRGFV